MKMSELWDYNKRKHQLRENEDVEHWVLTQIAPEDNISCSGRLI